MTEELKVILINALEKIEFHETKEAGYVRAGIETRFYIKPNLLHDFLKWCDGTKDWERKEMNKRKRILLASVMMAILIVAIYFSIIRVILLTSPPIAPNIQIPTPNPTQQPIILNW